MIKLGILVGILWIVGFILLSFMAGSRALFDPPKEGWSTGGLLGLRLFIAAFWWLMLLSPSGRGMIGELWKGEITHD